MSKPNSGRTGSIGCSKVVQRRTVASKDRQAQPEKQAGRATGPGRETNQAHGTLQLVIALGRRTLVVT
eukprot:764156-Hanusia_phi.AAC.1